MSEFEESSWNNEVSKQLDIGESTLRKWCIELEENGYTFTKGAKKRRAFTDRDLAALLYFKTLIRAKNHTTKQAAIAVIEKYVEKGESKSPRTSSLESNRLDLDKMIKKLLDHADRQEKFNEYLLERLDKQDRFINEILNRLDGKLQQNKDEKNRLK